MNEQIITTKMFVSSPKCVKQWIQFGDNDDPETVQRSTENVLQSIHYDTNITINNDEIKVF